MTKNNKNKKGHTEEKNNFKQLELFQDTSDYEDDFENAKEIKQRIQNLYSTLQIEKDFDNNKKQYYILNFKVKVTQLSIKPEPSSPKLFMRNYMPVLEIYDSTAIGNPIYTEKFNEKTIPKIINEMYIGSIISQELFYELSKQYILLETINNFFNDDFSINGVNSKLKSKTKNIELNSEFLIINVCSKFLTRFKPTPTNPYIDSAINRINRLSNKLTSQPKIIVLGGYLNYSFENDLINDIDDNPILKFKEKISSYYQNDFLFLNNMEFLSDKQYTKDWNPIIIPTKVLKIENNKIEGIDFNKMQQLYYTFQKFKNDGFFYRTEFYIPSSFRLKEYLWEILILSKELVKHNEIIKND